MLKISEKDLTIAIAQYLQMKHKNIIYKFDLASDLKLTIGQASRHKKIHPERGHPDFIIYEKRGDCGGLFIELKTGADEVYKKDGTMRENRHIKEQVKFMEKLVSKGYECMFGLGYKDTVMKIEKYLKSPK